MITSIRRPAGARWPWLVLLLLGLFLASSPLLARAQSPSADTFNPTVNGGSVTALALQADGRVILGGDFTFVGGYPHFGLARVNADGTPDESFSGWVSGGTASSLALQEDGKLLVAGNFTMLAGQFRNGLGRLNADGTLDQGFDPNVSGGAVSALALQADGKLLVGGAFTMLGGQWSPGLGRLNTNGTLDSGFSANLGGGSVNALAVLPDGKILIGGTFSTVGGQYHENIARVNADGTVDWLFTAGASGTQVSVLAVQPDGKILVAGSFTNLNWQAHENIGRLNADGTLDWGFNAAASGGSVSALALETDGRLVVAGSFNLLVGQTRDGLGLLSADGTLDSSFTAGATGGSVSALALQPDGKLLAGGSFTSLAWQWRNGLGRLNSTDPATQSLVYNGSTVTWSRGGTSPEVWRVAFAHSPDGVNWTSLGDGTRAPGGWQLSGVSVGAAEIIRARGCHVASGSLSEYMTPPAVTGQPVSQSRLYGGSVDFNVTAAGVNLSYQWWKDGSPLFQRTNVTLTLTNLQAIDAGLYWAVVSSPYGSATSAVATLTLYNLVITGQPASRTNVFGETATFSVTASGDALAYRWWKDGQPLPQATNPTLSLANLKATDAGNYWAVVSNPGGSLSSATATLTLFPLLITAQPTNATRNLGQSVTFSVTARGTNLLYQWWKDGQPLTQRTNASLSLANLQTSDVGSYWVVVSNPFGSVASCLVQLTVNPTTVDLGFNPGLGLGIQTLALDGEGKLLVGGLFTAPPVNSYQVLCRLYTNGNYDASFGFRLEEFVGNRGNRPTVYGLAVQADGKIVIAGDIMHVTGQPLTNIARLNPDGSLDSGFVPPSLDWPAYALAIQPDNRILVGGYFSVASGGGNSLARLNPDGSPDLSFTGTTSGGEVYALGLQPDGRIIVAGRFYRLGNIANSAVRASIGRIYADGSLDTPFNPGLMLADGPGGAGILIRSVVLQPDGKIVIGGDFTMPAYARTNLARLNPDGSLDSGFTANADSIVMALALQTDGSVVVAGCFTTLGGQPRSGIARLNPDGTLDPGFNPGDPVVPPLFTALAIQASGKIVLSGYFDTIGGQARSRLARLNNTSPAWQSLARDGSTLTWSRTGSSPEIRSATLTYTTNGLSWTSLGPGMRTAAGWQWTQAGIPTNMAYRVSARVAGSGRSDWSYETLVGSFSTTAPVIVINDGQFGVSSGHFGFNVRAEQAQVVIIEGSFNLQQWVPLRTNIMSSSQFHFIDPTPAQLTEWFYRAHLFP